LSSPIFIVGANRSGTTLLRLILNAHPRIAIPDELIYFESRLAGIPIGEWRDPGLSPDAYEDFVERVLKTRCQTLDELDRSTLKSDILDGRPTLRRPYRCILEAWARHHGKRRWGEKTPGNLFYVDILLEMFPAAQFIYVVRDPRAGVASMQRVDFFPDDVVFNALSRRKHDTTGRALLTRLVPASQRTTVRYEDLVQRPEATTRSVCAFLDEPFSHEMLNFHQDADQYMRDEAEEHYNSTATQPITDERVDAWTDRLTDEQVAVVERICRGTMEDFGYARTDRPLSLSAWTKLLVKRAYWALQCWRHRHRRGYTVKYQMLARTRSRLQTLLARVGRGTRSISPFHSG
jgi:hypothetical protein